MAASAVAPTGRSLGILAVAALAVLAIVGIFVGVKRGDQAASASYASKSHIALLLIWAVWDVASAVTTNV